ncbi:heme A synthase [Aurantibacter sp.]|uniref:COX15/CtaA family protein n=1 Tax=Aurantibacter sp. TaxID=2807103 RepID=UPI0035C80514
MRKSFRNISKTALVCVYLIIIAGAIVRMTGSGMGCPDWPKCFGYYVPPSDEKDIVFKVNHEYKEGIIIVNNESLLVAKNNFKSGNILNPNNWEAYTEHSYAKYNPTHTWIEYINRLATVLAGIPVLIMFLLSFLFWHKHKLIPILGTLTILGMGFQAWLGKTVVDSNLSPYKITIHMVMALAIVAFILGIIYLSKTNYKLQKFDVKFRNILVIAIILSLVQIVIGTQVRQDVDQQIKLVGNIKTLWLNNPNIKFYVHRTFSILVFLLNVWLLYYNKKHILGYNKIKLVIACIGIEIVTGIAMYYFNFPFLSQPLHIVVASIMIGIQFYIFLEAYSKAHKIA